MSTDTSTDSASNPGQSGPKGGKPGAMTMAMQAVRVAPSGPKILRIGVIQNGKIVEERLIRKRESVAVGTSEKNHFIVHESVLPARFELFQLVGSDYILNFTDAMEGRVALPGGVQDLKKLRSSGGARNAGSHWQIKLNDSSRGKVVIGATTLLFQFVTPPPVQPRPQLPATVRGGFAKSIDWLFTAFMVFTYMTFFAFVVYLESSDWPVKGDMAEIPEEFAKFILDEPEPPEEEETPETQEETEEEEETQVAEAEPQRKVKETPSQASEVTAEQAAKSAEARAAIAEQATQAAEALLLGALGDGGALSDVLAGGAVTGNAADVLAQAEGVGVATSQAGSLRTRSGGEGSGQGGDLGSLRAAGGDATKARAEGGAIQERRIRGKVAFQSGDEIGGAGIFDQSQVTRMIRGRQSAFRRCYETALRNNPSLSGKVVVEFTIQERGNVSSARAVENTTNDPGLGTCVMGVVRSLRWREGPEGGSVTFAYPFVFAPQS